MEVFHLKHGKLDLKLLFTLRTFRKVLEIEGIDIGDQNALNQYSEKLAQARAGQTLDFLINVIYCGMVVYCEANRIKNYPFNIVEIDEHLLALDENSNLSEVAEAFFKSLPQGNTNEVQNVIEQKKT